MTDDRVHRGSEIDASIINIVVDIAQASSSRNYSNRKRFRYGPIYDEILGLLSSAFGCRASRILLKRARRSYAVWLIEQSRRILRSHCRYRDG